MGPRVESRSLEVPACVLEERARSSGRRGASLGEKAIDVEHAEADAFHVKGGDRAGERGALVEQPISHLTLRLLLQQRAQLVDAVFGRLAVFGRCIGHGSLV